jgi:peptidoglycan/xylan/chitin deacetylase (PgdA/CDA1 family)
VEPLEPLCTWDELRELESRGVAVQSHAASHCRLSDLDSSGAIAIDVQRSSNSLSSQLGRAPRLLAYPYGDPGADPAVTAHILVLAGYRAACLYGGGILSLPSQLPYRLPRIAMGPETDLAGALSEAA